MAVTTFSSREFSRNVGRAKKATIEGPVFITNRGKTTHVLLSIEAYQRLIAQRRNIVDALAMPGLADIEFDPPRITNPRQPGDF